MHSPIRTMPVGPVLTLSKHGKHVFSTCRISLFSAALRGLACLFARMHSIADVANYGRLGSRYEVEMVKLLSWGLTI